MRLVFAAAVAAMLFLSGIARASVIENGIYYNASEPGRGYSIEQQGGSLTLIFYAYEPGGAGAWYFANGGFTRNGTGYPTATLPIGQYAGGQCLGCKFAAPAGTTVGAVTVAFATARTATLTLDGGVAFGTGGSTTLSLERFTFSDASNPLLGQWAWAYAITTSSPSWTNTYGGFVRFTTVGSPISTGGTGRVTGSPSGYIGECFASGTLSGSCVVSFTSGSFTEYYVITSPLNEWRGYYAILGGSGLTYRVQGVRVGVAGEANLYGPGTAADAAPEAAGEDGIAARRAADRGATSAPRAPARDDDAFTAAVHAAVQAMR